MKRFIKLMCMAAVILMAVVLLTAQVVQALREAALPPALPYGLTLQDTMATVEQRLGQPRVVHAPQAGREPGLPDEGGSPDRMHYWAIYRRFGLIVVYDTPSPQDKGAGIHTILPLSRDS
jgi:hypothetical protein